MFPGKPLPSAIRMRSADGAVHPEEKHHAQVPFFDPCRRARDRVRVRPGRRAVQQHVLLRRQRDRRRFVQAGPAAGHRPFHDQSGRSVGADARQPLRLRDHAGQPGRHRLRAGRRARHAVARLSAASRRRPARCRSRRRCRRPSPRASTATPSTRSRAATTTSSPRFGLLQAGQITSAQLQANVALAATQLAQQVGILKATGANYIAGHQPLRHRQDAERHRRRPGRSRHRFSAITGLFNSTLNAALNQVGGNVIRFNAAGLFNEILTNPAAYGITNTTATACGATPSLLCTPANLVTPNAASTYLFADGVHPTTAGHAIVAQAVGSMIEGPMQMAALGEAPLAVEQANFRALDGRMWSNLNSAPQQQEVQRLGRVRLRQQRHRRHRAVGQRRPQHHHRRRRRADVGQDPDGHGRRLHREQERLRQQRRRLQAERDRPGTVYAGYGDGPWYVGVSMLVGDLDYSTTRNITLGTGDAHRVRRHRRLHVRVPPARRLLVQGGVRAGARAVRQGRVPGHHRPRVQRERLRARRRCATTSRTANRCRPASAGRSAASGARCGRGRA